MTGHPGIPPLPFPSRKSHLSSARLFSSSQRFRALLACFMISSSRRFLRPGHRRCILRRSLNLVESALVLSTSFFVPLLRCFVLSLNYFSGVAFTPIICCFLLVMQQSRSFSFCSVDKQSSFSKGRSSSFLKLCILLNHTFRKTSQAVFFF